MRTIGLTHYYTLLKEHYAVETSMTADELNKVIAYMQLVRDDLPAMELCEDVLGEDDSSAILEKLFGCRRIVSDTPVDCEDEIDLHDNWSNVACPMRWSGNFDYEWPHRTAVAKAILDEMIVQAECCLSRNDSPWRATLLEHLKAFRRGEPAQSEWQLSTISGKPVVGLMI